MRISIGEVGKCGKVFPFKSPGVVLITFWYSQLPLSCKTSEVGAGSRGRCSSAGQGGPCVRDPISSSGQRAQKRGRRQRLKLLKSVRALCAGRRCLGVGVGWGEESFVFVGLSPGSLTSWGQAIGKTRTLVGRSEGPICLF